MSLVVHETQRAVASDLGINYRRVNTVARGRSWAHVQ
jgi:hypothetical protein